jgi:RNA polymerase primary sigma factor
MSKKPKASVAKKPARPAPAKAAPRKAAAPAGKTAAKSSPKATKAAPAKAAPVKSAAKPTAKATIKPAVAKPAAAKPAAPKPAAPKPAAPKVAAAKPVATKPAPAKASPEKSTVEKAAAAPKSAVAKPAVGKVVAPTKSAAAPAAAPVAPAVAAAPAAPVKGGKATKASKAAAAEGSKVLAMPERRPLALPEERQSQLKQLIALGKEQSYLTYSQVNDYLPSEIVDPEQIEEIVNTINDMGIPVYEKAPESDALLAPETTAPSDEEAIEEAAAALAALDAELGRTTDPVRMYMREMGTVELLTREGEISIAKRIEEGLDNVRKQVSLYPPTYDFIFKAYEPVKTPGGGRLADIIVGFIDPNAPDVIAQPQNPTKVEAAAPAAEDEETEDGEDSEEAVDTGPDPVEAAARFASLQKLHSQLIASITKIGIEDPKTQKIRSKLSAEFMELKLAPRMFEALIDNLLMSTKSVSSRRRSWSLRCVTHRCPARNSSPPSRAMKRAIAGSPSTSRRARSGLRRSRSTRTRSASGSCCSVRSRSCTSCRSAKSRISIAKCRSARPRPAALKRRWSRPTCAWLSPSPRTTPTAACSSSI